jgi:hypothetical protein
MLLFLTETIEKHNILNLTSLANAISDNFNCLKKKEITITTTTTKQIKAKKALS